MRSYLDLCEHVLTNGRSKEDRTGTGTKSVFGYQMRQDLSQGFPLLTTKRVFFKGVVHELLWFIKGDTNVKYLNDHGVHIWDDWADEEGDLGPIYGESWRNWNGEGIDQLSNLIEEIKTNPSSRRMILTAWNPAKVPQMALPPCHAFTQFNVCDGRLSCHQYQRSCDVFLGLPFNIASYALLTMMLAQVTGLLPGELIQSFGDLHIYQNHIEQVKLQLTREPRNLPRLTLNLEVKSIFDFRYEDITLEGYDPHPPIKGEISV